MKLSTRFWSKVSKGNGCWLWLSDRIRSGYGRISTGTGATELAHRVAWKLTNGAIPPGMIVCHHCDNKPCVNPAHLFLGTERDNVLDMESKGRAKHPNGKDNGRAKLSEAEARNIRSSNIATKLLAEKYRVNQTTIQRIRRGDLWRHLSCA